MGFKSRWNALRVKKRIFFDGLLLTLRYVNSNRLRTFLSLLGVTVGIFTIVGVLVAVDSLRNSVEASLNTLGSSEVYVTKWPWNGDNENVPWQTIAQFPQPDYRDYQSLKQHCSKAAQVSMTMEMSMELHAKDNSVPNVAVRGCTFGAEKILDLEVEVGRGISLFEQQQGAPVAVLGNALAKSLFPKGSAIGKTVKIKGKDVRVIGVAKEQGATLISMSIDRIAIVPYAFLRQFVSTGRAYGEVIVTPRQGISLAEIKDEITQVLRSNRALKPRQRNNFFLNSVEGAMDSLGSIFKMLNLVGWILGGFSILVGGFGIANIMFVSVKERTRIIGIQKSLGAKRWFIMTQFLFESMLLSLMGGMMGLLLLWGLVALINTLDFFPFVISLRNVVTGLVLSSVIGLLSGYLPARSAAKLDPIVAITTTV